MDLEASKHYGSWSGAEIESFLASARAPLRLSFVSKNGPLIVPVWFEYESSRFVACSPNDSLLVAGLRANPEVAFDVSTNEIPYRGVRGRGLAHCSAAADKTALEGLLNRYLANTNNDLSRWLLSRTGTEAVIEITIDYLSSWDFSDRMGGIEKIAERMPGASL